MRLAAAQLTKRSLAALFITLLLGQAAVGQMMDTVNDPDFDDMVGSGSGSGEDDDTPTVTDEPPVECPFGDDSTVRFLPACDVPEDNPDKPCPPATLQDAENKALCFVGCMHTEVSGEVPDEPFLGGTLADFIPLSYLENDRNRVCQGYDKVQICRVGCELGRSGLDSNCALQCQSDCSRLSNAVCTVTNSCNGRRCQAGCDEAQIITDEYPDRAIPNSAPVLGRAEANFKYNLDIDALVDDIMAPLTLNLRTSAILIKINDTSSLEEEISYIVLDDMPVLNLTPFACRSVEVSYAIVSQLVGTRSPFSPATTLNVTPNARERDLPDQLDGFNYTVEEDDRLQFFDHHVIHLEWDEPNRSNLIENYTVQLSPYMSRDGCDSITISVSPNATSFTVRAATKGDAPFSACRYQTTITANPFLGDPATLPTKFIIVPEYQRLSNDNVGFAVSVELNRSTTLYNVRLNWTLSVPDPVLYTINSLEVVRIIRLGSSIQDTDDAFAKVVVPNTPNISQTFEVVRYDLAPLTDSGRFYRFQSLIRFERGVRAPGGVLIRHDVTAQEVSPSPPDQVVDISISASFFQIPINNRTVFGDIEFSWVPPEFRGFAGILRYEVYIGRVELEPDAPRPTGIDARFIELPADAQSGSMRLNEVTDEQQFTVFFQIRPRTLHAAAKWSEAIPIDVSPFDPPMPDAMTERDFDTTLSVFRPSPNGGSVTITFSVAWTVANSTFGNVTNVEVAVGVTELGPNDVPQQSFTFPARQGSAEITAALDIPNRLLDSFEPFPIFVQMRAITEFNVTGAWNESEVIRPKEVFPPENITVALLDRRVGTANDNSTLSLSVTVELNWSPPSEFPASDIEQFTAFLGEEFTVEPFGSVPTSARSATFERDLTTGTITGVFVVEDAENFTLFVQMRTESTFGASGEWSEPVSVFVTRPGVDRTALILGTAIPFGIVLLILLLLLLGCCLFFLINSLRIKYGYKTVQSKSPGLDDYGATYIPAGYFVGKELLLDDWEVAANDCIVEEKLGEGAFGEVYKGVMRGPMRNPKISAVLKNTIGLPVAVKLLKTTASNKEKAEFLSEIELMKKIAEGYNAHIVNMIGCITLQEPLCLITEFVPHGDLISYLKAMRKRAATDRRRQRFLQQHYEAYQEMKRLALLKQQQQENEQKMLKQQDDIERGYTFLPAVTRPIQLENGIEGDSEKAALCKEAPTSEERSRTPTDDQAAYADYLQSATNDNDNKPADAKSLDEEEITSPAPYMEAVNEYSHLDPLSPVDLEQFAPQLPPELIDEADFDEYSDVGKLEAGDLMQFAYQIATGMEYLASLSIVHRDLACRNILVGDDKKLKITDFGLSREVEEVYVKQTKGRLPLKWMALESIEERVFTTASDVWSYGVTLWEISTVGGFPYPTIPNTDLLMMLKQGYRLEKPETCAPQVYDIMLECWQEEVSERPDFSQLRSKFDALISAATDDPYMQLEVDEMMPYYSADAEEEGKQFANTERANAKGGGSFRKGKKQLSLQAKPSSNPYVENPTILSASVPVTSYLPEEDSIRSPPELVSHAEIENEAEEEEEEEEKDDERSGLDEQSAYADQPAMRPIPRPGFREEISDQQSPTVGIPLSMLNPSHKAITPADATKSFNPYVDEPGRRMAGDEVAVSVVGNGNQPIPDQITVL